MKTNLYFTQAITIASMGDSVTKVASQPNH